MDAFQDPTEGKPFFPWLWEDQFKPTIQASYDKTGISILTAGALTTAFSHQYDTDVYEQNVEGKNLFINKNTARDLAHIGSGALGVSIAATQILFDQENGLMHARALALTSLTHVTLAFLVQRPRPDGRGDFLPFPSAYPSGHAASAFATAGSLAYAYGWKAGVPAYLMATAISLARVYDNSHWISDIAAGTTLGVFWARASHQAHQQQSLSQSMAWMPFATYDTLGFNFYYSF